MSNNNTFTLCNSSYAGLNASILESGNTLLSCTTCKKSSAYLMPKCQPRRCQTEKMTTQEIQLLTPKPMISKTRPNKYVNAFCHMVCPECFHSGDHNANAKSTSDGPLCASCDEEIRAGTRHKDMGFQPVLSSAPIQTVQSLKTMLDEARTAADNIRINDQLAEKNGPGGSSTFRTAEAEQRRINNAEKRARPTDTDEDDVEAKRQRDAAHAEAAEAKKQAAEAKKQAAEAKKQAAKEAAQAKQQAEREAKKAADEEKKRKEAEAALTAEREERAAIPVVPAFNASTEQAAEILGPIVQEAIANSTASTPARGPAQRSAPLEPNGRSKNANKQAKYRANNNMKFFGIARELHVIPEGATEVSSSVIPDCIESAKRLKKVKSAYKKALKKARDLLAAENPDKFNDEFFAAEGLVITEV